MLPVSQAKGRLGDLLLRVAYGGETVVITRHGRPIVRIVPVSSEERERPRPFPPGIEALTGAARDVVGRLRGARSLARSGRRR
ncbi:MAG: type II toxin-antitoxin system prevent-host-death family antitoxin [Myxococcota bacterium]